MYSLTRKKYKLFNMAVVFKQVLKTIVCVTVIRSATDNLPCGGSKDCRVGFVVIFCFISDEHWFYS